MKSKLCALIVFVLLAAGVVLSQQPQGPDQALVRLRALFKAAPFSQQPPGPDPIGDNFFPPELVMQHQQAIGLTEEQKTALKSELRSSQIRFTELQWQLQDEMEKMAALVKSEQVDEQQVLAQLDKVLNAEREIKRTQIALVIRIKNRLTADQQARLQKIKSEFRMK